MRPSQTGLAWGEELRTRTSHDVGSRRIAVVVDAVSGDLGRAGPGEGLVVVAVARVVDVALRGAAGCGGDVRVAVTVSVTVPVEGLRPDLVDLAVAVVVDAVADLLGSRMDGRVGIVAVLVVPDVTVGYGATGRGGTGPEAVSVAIGKEAQRQVVAVAEVPFLRVAADVQRADTPSSPV